MLRLSASSFAFTPTQSMPLAGYTRRSGIYDRIDGNLEAVFLRLCDDSGNDVLIGSVDTLFLTDRSISDIRDALGDFDTPLLLFATHTHNAPSLAPDLPLLGRHDPKWYQGFVSACADAVKELSDRQEPGDPVTLRYGKQRTGLNINRRLPSRVLDYPALLREHRLVYGRRIALAENKRGFIDPWLRAIFLEDQQGRVRGVIWTLAAHPARYPGFTRVSPDFPGLIRDAVRGHFGANCAVIYLPGLAGSALPRMPRHLPADWKQACLWLLPFYPQALPVRTGTYQAWVDRVLDALLQAYRERQLPVDDTGISVTRTCAPDIFQARCNGSDLGLQITRVSLAENLGILAFNGEMLGEWTPLLESVATGVNLFSGYLAGPALYVPTSLQLPEGGYEVTGFQAAFGLDGEFHPDISGRVISAAGSLYGVRP